MVSRSATDELMIVLDVATAVRSVEKALLGDSTSEFDHLLAADVNAGHGASFDLFPSSISAAGRMAARWVEALR
jgi:hypothetical protein